MTKNTPGIGKYMKMLDYKKLAEKMEEIAGMSKEELPYVRQPGERCSYEISSRERYEKERLAKGYEI